MKSHWGLLAFETETELENLALAIRQGLKAFSQCAKAYRFIGLLKGVRAFTIN
jgi:hypothetical protein